MEIQYIFSFYNGNNISFKIDLENYSVPVGENNFQDLYWTKLGYNQCEFCTLKQETHEHCSPALNIADIANKFKSVASTEKVIVKVATPERLFIRETDAQSGLNSVFGLVMALSDCPILTQLRYMARHHLPFSTFEETLARTAGYYLLKQYLLASEGGVPDYELHGLVELYSKLNTVNLKLKERLSQASKKDANVNAINIFFNLSTLVELSIKEKITDLKSLFD